MVSESPNLFRLRGRTETLVVVVTTVTKDENARLVSPLSGEKCLRSLPQIVRLRAKKDGQIFTRFERAAMGRPAPGRFCPIR